MRTQRHDISAWSSQYYKRVLMATTVAWALVYLRSITVVVIGTGPLAQLTMRKLKRDFIVVWVDVRGSEVIHTLGPSFRLNQVLVTENFHFTPGTERPLFLPLTDVISLRSPIWYADEWDPLTVFELWAIQSFSCTVPMWTRNSGFKQVGSATLLISQDRSGRYYHQRISSLSEVSREAGDLVLGDEVQTVILPRKPGLYHVWENGYLQALESLL